jgi:glyoxylase-like metal-dependent hydrolase (beta-lactamase superfamily II)
MGGHFAMTPFRMMLSIAAALAVSVAGAYAQGQPDFSKVEIKTTDLGHDTYMLEGQGGNVIVAVGSDAVIEVDGEFAPLHDKIKAAVDKVSGGKPIKYLINTHFHGDHTGGNGPFHRDGTIIVAQANVAKRLEDGSVNGLSGVRTNAVGKDWIPGLTYSEGLELTAGGRHAAVNHPLHAHTDGDSFVNFADANVIATGDIVSRGPRYPTIDYANGGSLNGIIATVEAYIRMGNAETKYVPGHGPLTTRAELQQYHDMLEKVRDQVTAEIQAGKSEDQAVADKPLAGIGATLHSTQVLDDNEVRMAYRSLMGAPANPA